MRIVRDYREISVNNFFSTQNSVFKKRLIPIKLYLVQSCVFILVNRNNVV